MADPRHTFHSFVKGTLRHHVLHNEMLEFAYTILGVEDLVEPVGLSLGPHSPTNTIPGL